MQAVLPVATPKGAGVKQDTATAAGQNSQSAPGFLTVLKGKVAASTDKKSQATVDPDETQPTASDQGTTPQQNDALSMAQMVTGVIAEVLLVSPLNSETSNVAAGQQPAVTRVTATDPGVTGAASSSTGNVSTPVMSGILTDAAANGVIAGIIVPEMTPGQEAVTDGQLVPSQASSATAKDLPAADGVMVTVDQPSVLAAVAAEAQSVPGEKSTSLGMTSPTGDPGPVTGTAVTREAKTSIMMSTTAQDTVKPAIIPWQQPVVTADSSQDLPEATKAAPEAIPIAVNHEKPDTATPVRVDNTAAPSGQNQIMSPTATTVASAAPAMVVDTREPGPSQKTVRTSTDKPEDEMVTSMTTDETSQVKSAKLAGISTGSQRTMDEQGWETGVKSNTTGKTRTTTAGGKNDTPSLSGVAFDVRLQQQPIKPLPAETSATRNENMEKILQKLEVMVRDNASEAKLVLKPEHLGTLTVKMALEEGGLVARFITDNHQAKAMLESNLTAFRQQMEQNGVRVERVEVSVANQGFDTSSQFSGQGQPQYQGQQRSVTWLDSPEAAFLNYGVPEPETVTPVATPDGDGYSEGVNYIV